MTDDSPPRDAEARIFGEAAAFAHLACRRIDGASPATAICAIGRAAPGGQRLGMGAGAPACATPKAARSALTRALAGVLVNAVCPGRAAPGMGGDRLAENGAAGVLRAALRPDGGPTGGFFRHGRTRPGDPTMQGGATPLERRRIVVPSRGRNLGHA